MVTLYLLVLRSEGQVELQYALWARSALLIALLHWIFARRAVQSGNVEPGMVANGISQHIALPRFPNLMR
jgi:hypothetical protein